MGEAKHSHRSRRSSGSGKRSVRSHGSSMWRRVRRSRPVRMLGLPFKWLWFPFRVLRNTIDHWHPFGFVAALWHRFFSLTRWLLLGKVAEGQLKTNIREYQLQRPTAKSLKNPIAWCRWTVSFAARWALTRPLRSLVLALPALILAGGVFACASLGNRKFATQVAPRYANHLAKAVERKDTAEARLVLDAFVRLFPDEVNHRLTRALIEHEFGDKAIARELMEDLATSGRSAVAAMWLANTLGDANQMRSWPQEKLQAYVDWLVQASTNAPDDPLPRLVLADLLIAYGDLPRARAVLLPLGHKHPEVAYRVIQLELRTGMGEMAVRRAEPLLRALLPLLVKQPDNLTLRIRCATLQSILGRSSEAVGLLRDGIVHAATDEQRDMLERALTEALVLDAQNIAKMSKTAPNMMRRFRQLKAALGLDPDSSTVLQAVAEACIDSANETDVEVQQTRTEFLKALPPETVRFVEGTAALRRGQLAQAKELLQAGVEENTSSPGLLNNLAHAILQEAEPDLERALQLSEAALKSAPQHPYLRETHGQILFRMQRYKEAIEDLEFALVASELRADIRPNLAVAYEKTGQPDRARLQRELLASEANADR